MEYRPNSHLEQSTADLGPEQRTADLEPEQRTADLGPEQRTADLGPEQRAADLGPEERTADLGPEQRTADLGPEQRTADLGPGSPFHRLTEFQVLNRAVNRWFEPRHLLYCTKESRLKSYFNWLDLMNSSPNSLSEAVFFYAGKELCTGLFDTRLGLCFSPLLFYICLQVTVTRRFVSTVGVVCKTGWKQMTPGSNTLFCFLTVCLSDILRGLHSVENVRD
jgi:hypothetical protein